MLHVQHACLVLDFYDLDFDWLKKWRHGKRFVDSFSQTAFFGEEKRQPEIRQRSQAIAYIEAWKIQDFNGVWTRDPAIPVTL